MTHTIDPYIVNELRFETISLSLAALLIAWELGEWDGRDFSKSETAPYFQNESVRSSADGAEDMWVTKATHTWETTEPTGLLKSARDAVLAALNDSIEKGRLSLFREKREMNGKLRPTDSLLHVEQLNLWCTTHEIEVGDLLGEYSENEIKILESAMDAATAARFRHVNPHMQPPTDKDIQTSWFELMAENQRLKLRQPPQLEAPLTTKERNTLLAIIGLLAKKLNYPLSLPRKCGEVIASEAALEGFRTLSPGAVAKHIKAAVEAMEARKK